jgi:flagellar export protein FliJ
MKQQSKRMDWVTWLAAQSERAAAERLQASRHELDDLQRKLQQMEAVRAEYLTRLGSGTTMAIGEMRELHFFVEKLDAAIAQLHQQAQHKEKLNSQHREQWQGQRRRREALGNIANRYRRSEERTAENREQLEIDDRRSLRETP